jgi:diacylglycerol kinase (ATP)
MALSTLILLDPSARGRRTGAGWALRQSQVLRRLAPAEVAVVRGAGEAEHAAWHGALGGFGRLIAVGDSATAFGLVNGVMRLAENHRRALKLGCLSLGRPGPWSRSLELPTALERQLDVLAAGHTLPLDVGCVLCGDDSGRPATRYFVSGAVLGLGAGLHPTGRPGPLGALHTLAALAAGLRRHALGRLPRVRLTVEGRVLHEGPWLWGAAMLGRHYPLLGALAPQAHLSDGALELCWFGGGNPWGDLGRLGALLLRPRGAASAWVKAGELRLEALSGAPALEADGIALGRLPASVTVLPRALPVIVEAVAARLRGRTQAALAEAQGAALAGHFKRASHAA